MDHSAMQKPSGFEDALSDYGPVLFDSCCDEPVAWGFRIIRHLGEEKFNALRRCALLECAAAGNWVVIAKKLTREEVALKYRAITEEISGPRGGWKSTTFGETRFISKALHPGNGGSQ